MTGELRSALSNAMQFDTSERRIDAVKATVGNFLRASDPTAQIGTTEYFNHTFAPDLVLSWPRENRRRLVFLRANNDPRWLADDLRVIAPSHPIVLTLEPNLRSGNESDRNELLGVARESRALVADPDAIEEFSTPAAPIASVLSNAVIRGGLGLLDELSARTAADTAIVGFTAAASLDVQPTREALLIADSLLDDEQATRLTRLYRAVWEGQGGAAAQFPSSRSTAGPLTGNDLLLLLATLDTGDLQFWRRIGRDLRLEQLTEIESLPQSSNLDRLIEANLDRLAARGARVYGTAADTPDIGVPRWAIDRHCAVLASGQWAAYFATKASDLPPPERRSGVPVRSLMEEVRALGVRMTDVKVMHSDFTISIESIGEADVVDSPDFTEIAARGDSLAHSAAIAMPSGRNLIAEFMTGTASGHTNATFPLSELSPAAIRLLLELTRRQSDELTARLTPPADAKVIQPGLWD
jgi:hypothetical protein